MRIPVFLTAAFCMTACGFINPLTAARLANLDPLAADPADMSVAFTLPSGLGIDPRSTFLTLTATAADASSITGRYRIVEAETGIWRIATDDQTELRDDLRRVRAWESADPEGTSGSFSVSLQPCLEAEGPEAGARVSVHLQLEPGGPFLPLLNRVRFTTIMQNAEISQLSRCPPPGVAPQ